jgi:hypothetical protein
MYVVSRMYTASPYKLRGKIAAMNVDTLIMPPATMLVLRDHRGQHRIVQVLLKKHIKLESVVRYLWAA